MTTTLQPITSANAPTYAQLRELAKLPSRHSPIGFSGTDRWWNCPGSVLLIKSLPPEQRNRSSVYAFEGNVDHLVAAQRINVGAWPEGTPDHVWRMLQVYIDLWRSLVRKATSRFYVEHKFELPEVHPESYGTADLVVVNEPEGWAAIVDLKTGKGKGVEVSFWDDVTNRLRGNRQLMGYALGVVRRLSPAIERVHLYIAQPPYDHPDGPIRMHEVTLAELMDFEVELRRHAAATDNPDAPLKAGPHCQFCPAAHICPAVREENERELQTAFEPVNTYDPAQLARALQWIYKIRPWMKQVLSLANDEARAGRVPAGHKLVNKRNAKKWRDAAEYALLEMGLPPDLIYTAPELRTPHQIELATRGEVRKKVAGLYVKQSSGVKLVPESEPGEPVTGLLPETMFEAVEEDDESEETV